MSRPSNLQVNALVEFLERNPDVARGILKTSQGKSHLKKKWEEVTIHLNSLGGIIKDSKGWMKLWSNKKYYLKKIVNQKNASMRQTGGGRDSSHMPLDDLDERMVAVLGGTSFALGDESLQIPLDVDMEVQQDSINQEVTPDEAPLLFEAPRTPLASTSRRSSPQRRSLPTRTRYSPRRRPGNAFEMERERILNLEERRIEAEWTRAEAEKERTKIERERLDVEKELLIEIKGVGQTLGNVCKLLEQISQNLATK